MQRSGVRPTCWKRRRGADRARRPAGGVRLANLGVCTPIKDQQEDCFAGWALALNGEVESAIAILDGVQVDLSEQWLISCASLAGGCDGGSAAVAANYYLRSGQYTDYCDGYGAVLEADFPYEAWYIPCDCPYSHSYCIEGWTPITGDGGAPGADDLKRAILEHGPIVAALSGINSAFEAYAGGIFRDCTPQGDPHEIVLVGWNDDYCDGEDCAGVWILRNSQGENWGENGYMYIEYGCLDVGDESFYVTDSPPPLIVFDYPAGRPKRLKPNEATALSVAAIGLYGAVPDPDSGVLHCSLNGSEWNESPLAPSTPDYVAVLPAAECFDAYRWYVSFRDSAFGGTYFDPAAAPEEFHQALVATDDEILFIDEFETDRGWQVQCDAEAGNFDRADPEESVTIPGTLVQPEDDHTPDPGRLCYVTGPLFGGSSGYYDVDNGITSITSPILDLEGTDPTISYWRWYHVSASYDDDFLTDVSNDAGATWVNVETLDDRETWTRASWKLADYAAPTSQVLVRFTVSDLGLPSLIEALVDDFLITTPVCVECRGDLDGDSRVDLRDLARLLGQYGRIGGARYAEGDIDHDGDVDLADLGALLAVYGSTCD